ncbi:PREDICTED: uncharacterized protein LOC108562075 [Nicrophorus vespilloides]|uniref:Uncharacterized protein LOC108562075 n=1 Tax=Nicrophorus vespilloides TaxID=110193 RepID=A0ABM1MMG9_NICVS|nr:PREDICTED: uncharacterized protein LOC108562075 [Nicrophorus vespilloides]
MNRFLVLTVALVCVNARPDIGLKLREAGSPTGSYLPGVGGQQESYGSSQTFQTSPGHLPTYNTYNPVVSHILENKNFFFDAPEDLGETHVRVHVQPSAAAGEKSIFIRAPSYNSKIVPHFNIAQQQAAGKTKVYVLVKKPEEQQDIVVPATVQATAAQPEVVFIKYKTQKEAEEKIKNIQDGATGGTSAKTVFNHRELVSSIKDEPAHQHHQQTISYTGPIIEQSAGAPALAGIQSFGPSTIGGPSVIGSSSVIGSPSVSSGPTLIGGGSTHSSIVGGGAPGAGRLIIDTIIGSPNPHSVAGVTTTVTQTGKGGISRTHDIVVPVAPQGPPASPEVFFVKYTDQKDVADKIHSIESGNTETLLKGNPLPHHEDLANAIPESSSVTAESTSVVTKEESHEFGPAGESGPY